MDIICSIATSSISFIFSALWNISGRQVGYLVNAGENIENLQNLFNDLSRTKREVDDEINTAMETSDEVAPTERVEEWKNQVQNIEEKVNKINDDYNHRSTCLCGCPINCWSSYRIGKKAAKTAVKVDVLKSKKPSDLIKTCVPPIREILGLPTTAPTSREVYLNQASQYLQGGEVRMVGIWGMGGVGKSTILKQINNHPSVAAANFNYVIMLTAPQELDLYRLQTEIAERVKLPLSDESLERRAQLINRFLRTKKVLLLLDDIWNSVDLVGLGVHCPELKVVFTTRSEDVCNAMMKIGEQLDMRPEMIKVDCMEKEEARKFFLEIVSKKVLSIVDSDEMIRRYAEIAADMCDGLLLALVVTAASLPSNRDLQEWENAIDSIKRVSSETNYFLLLKLSYDRLPSESIKKCFLHFALWPKDYEIEENELIICWLGMNLIEECEDISEAYIKGNSYIQHLKRVCLLEEGKGNSHGPIPKVKMHDIVRELALWIFSDCSESNKSWLILNEDQLRRDSRYLRMAKAISLVRGKVQDLSEYVSDSDFPNVSVVMLQETGFQLKIPESFFQNMQSLTYLDLSSTQLFDVPQAICCLTQLRFLNLSQNEVSSLPIGISKLKELKYLFLGHNTLTSIPHGLISSLEKLEILDLFYTGYNGWNKEGEASFNELLKCSGTRALGIEIRRLDNLEYLSRKPGISVWWLNVKKLKRVTTLSLSKSLLQVGNVRHTLRTLVIGECDRLEEIETNSISRERCRKLEQLVLYSLNNLKKFSFAGEELKSIRVLTVQTCNELKSITWILQLLHLQKLEVGYCDAMEQVIGDESSGGEALSNLESLQLFHLPMLSSFSIRPVSFSSLKFVDIDNCPKLDTTPFAHIPRDIYD